MKQRVPPRLPAWMLQHLTFGQKNEALVGDLWEELRGGRSVTWYWRQVIVAIVVGFTSEVRTQWPALCYAAFCVIAAPVFSVMAVSRVELFARPWRLDWPFSTICDLIIVFGSHLIYVWVALVMYFTLFSLATKTLDLPRLARSLWSSLLVFIFINLGLSTLVALVPHHAVHFIHTRPVTFLGLMMAPYLLERLDLFFTIFFSIWIALPPIKRATAATI